MSLTRVYENKKYIEVMKRGKLHPKICYYYKNKGLFDLKEGIKLIIMSDIRSITSFVIDDMIKILDASSAFYFVQGNYDYKNKKM